MASVKEAKELMAEMHSSGSLAVLAPINVDEKGTEISVLVQGELVVCRAVSASCVSLETFLYTRTVPELRHHKEESVKDGVHTRVAAIRWLQHRAGVEVFDLRPPTRIAGREELQGLWPQIASSTFERALRASGTDGVMTRPFYTTEEEKNQLPFSAFTSGFLTGWSLAENVMARRMCFWCGDDTLGTRRSSNNNRLRRSGETRAARERHKVSGRIVG